MYLRHLGTWEMADCNDISAWIVAAPEDPEETEMADEELTPVRGNWLHMKGRFGYGWSDGRIDGQIWAEQAAEQRQSSDELEW
ncbi:hypothetical protein E5D57_007734 [Metarhizium anisopliae]|nr:hypothetical protein E5D57_007734 [Metarhizium anisopliae]